MLSPGVGCGAAVLKQGRLLLIQRRREPEAGCWGLPGGKVDLFETSEQAIAREVAEELGIRISDLSLLKTVEQIDRDGGWHWVSPVYLAGAYAGEPELREPEKHGGFAWFGLDDLPDNLTYPTRDALPLLAVWMA